MLKKHTNELTITHIIELKVYKAIFKDCTDKLIDIFYTYWGYVGIIFK